MKLLVVGGVERNERALRKAAESAGHVFEFHGGHMQCRNEVLKLERAVEGADLVVIATGVNSHTAVMVARRAAEKHQREVRLVHSCSPSSFKGIVEGLPGV